MEEIKKIELSVNGNSYNIEDNKIVEFINTLFECNVKVSKIDTSYSLSDKEYGKGKNVFISLTTEGIDSCYPNNLIDLPSTTRQAIKKAIGEQIRTRIDINFKLLEAKAKEQFNGQ